MRTPALRYPRDIPPLQGTTAMAATTATTRLRSLMFPQPTPPRHLLRTAGRSQHLPPPPQPRNDMSQHCIVRSMPHQQRRLLSRRNTNPHTRRLTARNSTLGHLILPMASLPLQAPHIQRRPRTHHTLYTPRCRSDPSTPLTPIRLPTECLELARSHRQCRRLQPVPKPPPRSRGIQPMPLFPVARWTTCPKRRTGGSMAAAKLTSKSPRTA